MNESVVQKIQKLLSLANSDNEHEAKVAMSRANELLIKHNLAFQDVVDREFGYGTKDMITTGLTVKPYQHMIAGVLTRYFFVRVIINSSYVGESSGQWAWKNKPRTQFKKTIRLVGTKGNCLIAGYIFHYLNDMYPKLWNDYKEKTGADITTKKSYFLGLTEGIDAELEATKWRVEEETGLVVMKDPALDKYVDELTNGKSYSKNHDDDIDVDVFRDGLKDGKKVQLKKPIETTAVDNGLFLEHKPKSSD